MTLSVQKWIPLDMDGQEFVYLFFYPTYKDIAYMNEVSQWPCKIGRTDVNPVVRIQQQLNSSSPEEPEIALVFQCSDSRDLESVIHHYMKLHKRFLHHDFNKEWFNTNPDEVLNVIKTFALTPDDILKRGI